MEKINVGIVGCGVIGSALKNWVEQYNAKVDCYISDPLKGYNDKLDSIDIAFISIHIDSECNGSQDLTALEGIIEKLPNVPIFIRTTIVPGTADSLSKKFNKHVYFMPEFLTQRSAYEDFCSQPMVFTGEVDLLKKIFINKDFITMSNTEAELAKYAHNVFGALKVTYFNGIFDLCNKLNCSYEKVKQGSLLSGYINNMHTLVPGPDGNKGYGGKCFPKDVSAFINFIKDAPLFLLLKDMEKCNSAFQES